MYGLLTCGRGFPLFRPKSLTIYLLLSANKWHAIENVFKKYSTAPVMSATSLEASFRRVLYFSHDWFALPIEIKETTFLISKYTSFPT